MNHFLKLSIVDYYLKDIENSNNDIHRLLVVYDSNHHLF